MMTNINGKSILIIDDDAAMLRALNKVLSGEGAVVTSASWAGEVMERLADKRGRFDLIITDLRMPILDGQSILGAVKVALPKMPVIVVTAFSSPELEAECLDKGATAFLEKPLDTSQLLAVIEHVFSAPKPGSTRRAPLRGGARKADKSTSENKTDYFGRTKGIVHGPIP
jgi:DNA-binding NtrC family response regulator